MMDSRFIHLIKTDSNVFLFMANIPLNIRVCVVFVYSFFLFSTAGKIDFYEIDYSDFYFMTLNFVIVNHFLWFLQVFFFYI